LRIKWKLGVKKIIVEDKSLPDEEVPGLYSMIFPLLLIVRNHSRSMKREQNSRTRIAKVVVIDEGIAGRRH
jgi:hypothetical protein